MGEVLILGGGASGMMAALRASETGEHHVTLLERQARVGRKLLSTGNGRCNLSNMGADVSHYHGADPSFVRPGLTAFGPAGVRAYFASLGLMTEEEYGGRVFPMSRQAGSVVDVLRLALERQGVEIRTGLAAESVQWDSGFTVRHPEGVLRADRLIVACGGCAGSKLGGVMDGYAILKSLGHRRTALYPALTQIRTDPEYPRALKGIRADVRVTVLRDSQTLASHRGELLFSETGVSGTVIFEISRAVSAGGAGLTVSLDFFPELSGPALTEELLRRREALPDLPARQILIGTVHNRLGQMLCKYAEIPSSETAGGLTDRQLRRLLEACRDFRLPVTGVSGFETAQVTAGGIETAGFDPSTLESRLVPGLYACGEVLDVDGDCGGYNLQWAWSSGRLAGALGSGRI